MLIIGLLCGIGGLMYVYWVEMYVWWGGGVVIV